MQRVLRLSAAVSAAVAVSWLVADAAAFAVAGPTLEVRLTTALSTTKTKTGDAIGAVTVAPLVIAGRTVAAAGCVVSGVVTESLRPKGINDREVVAIDFATLVDRNKAIHKIKTKLVEVDNGRETVDEQGRILGIAPVDKKPDNPADVLKHAANGTQIMRALVSKMIGKVPPQIDYKVGAEFLLRVDQAPAAASIACGQVPPALAQSVELSRIVNAQPVRTVNAGSDQRPGDVTNLLFLGSRDVLDAAFKAAGWMTAEELNAMSSTKTFLATVAGEGYSEAPVSKQVIGGKAPDAVFQKQLNTFAKRHHLRIWQSADKVNGQTAWIAAATHDVGFVVSKETKLFTHGIDPAIDGERQKVVNDLAFGGGLTSWALVARSKAPPATTTNTGQTVQTDGKVAVIVLQTPAAKKQD